MVDTETLMREGGGRELEQSMERRRSRILGRILDLAPEILRESDASHLCESMGAQLRGLFPGCRFLVLVRGASDGAFAIAAHDLKRDELNQIQPVAERVGEAGVAAFTTDFGVDFDGISSCVPMRIATRSSGALFVAAPYGAVASSDELSGYLRRYASLIAIAYERILADVKRGQDLDAVTAVVRANRHDRNVALTIAKRSFERWLICARLREFKGNIAAAARSLHMDRGQLSRLVKRHAIDKSEFKS